MEQSKPKLIRMTTVPISLEKLLEGQLHFMQQYYDVTAVSADEENLKKIGKREGVKTYCVPMTRKITPFDDAKALWKFYRFLKKEKPQIVHSHTPKAGIVGMMAAKMAGVPHRLHTVAGLPLIETTGAKRKILNGVEKLTYACATKVYPNSKGLKQFILNEKLAAPGKVEVIGKGSSNGIDTTYFDPEQISAEEKATLRKQLNISEEELVFVFVGRLVGDKGINELVDAFVNLQIEIPTINLLLVGPLETDLDPLAPETISVIKNNKKIITVGFQPDVRAYFAISDVLVFPSYREGFPNVVLQANAMGLPAIVSDINGCNEIITEGENGLIVPVKNVGKLQAAMKTLTEDPEKRKKLHQVARKNITDHYERSEIWAEILKTYRAITIE